MSAGLRAGHFVCLCALALLTLGVVMVQSADMSIDVVETAPTAGAMVVEASRASLWEATRPLLISRHTVLMGLALIAMVAMGLLFPVAWLERVTGRLSGQGRLALLWLGGCTAGLLLVLLMVYVPGIGREVNGAHRWVGVTKSFGFQPSEVAKWVLIGVLAVYASLRARELGSFWRGLVPALLGLGLVAGVVAKEDLGTAVLIAGVGSIVLMAAGARVWHFVMFIPPAVAALVALIVVSPYRITRIETFLDPYSDPKRAGFHMIQSMAAVAGGEGWGRGLGDGLQKFDYLPEDTTDFLFAIVCEELGIAGALVVVALFAAMLWSGLIVVRKQRTVVMKLIGIGIVSTVGLQALINLAVVTGLGPTKGIALPLVSSGGTGWILTAASLGVLLAMDRHASREAVAEACGIPEPTAAGTLHPA
jgi:cell division protein FtsW